MAKLPRIEHVKFVRSKGRVYAYFNTGQRDSKGRTVYARLPDLSSEGFWTSYGAFKAGRTKRQAVDYTVADLIRDYERSAAFIDHAEGTKVIYGKTMRKIDRTLGEFPVNDLTAQDIEDVLEAEMADKPGAHNIYVAVIGALYKWARGRHKTELNPTAEIAKRKTSEHEPWPIDVLDAGLNAGDPLVRLAVHLLYFTGQRIGDVCKLRWGDIRGGYVSLVQQKTGKRVEVHLIADLAVELDRTPKRGLTILADDEGKPISRDTLRKVLQAFTASLGAKTVPHGLRKNAVNALLEAGCTIAEVAAITGQTFQIVEKYAARVNNRQLGKAAIIKLEQKRHGKTAKKTG